VSEEIESEIVDVKLSTNSNKKEVKKQKSSPVLSKLFKPKIKHKRRKIKMSNEKITTKNNNDKVEEKKNGKKKNKDSKTITEYAVIGCQYAVRGLLFGFFGGLGYIAATKVSSSLSDDYEEIETDVL